MRRARAPKRIALASAALAVTGLIAFPAAAAAGPGCEHILGPENCQKYYYDNQDDIDAIVIPVYQAAFDAVDTVFEVAIWAGDTYDCTVWGMCD